MQVSRKLGLALASLALTLTGCGDAGGAQQDDDSIRLMFIGQITDTANTTPRPEALAGVRAAIARLNAGGGIQGKPVVLLPRALNLVPLARGILPTQVFDFLQDWTGTSRNMDSFRGRSRL